MALSLVPPSLPPVPPTFLGEGGRWAPHALWGEETEYGSHRGNNITLTHVLPPIAVRPEVVESYMTSKPLQSDVSLLMSMTHNTKRRVPRYPNPAVFPRNDPERVDHCGRPVLTRGTRKSLEQCTYNLYGRSWSSQAFPDYSQWTQRLQKSPKLLQKLHQADRETFNDNEPFHYTTVYRGPYSKHSLVEDQGKVCLPPIQCKTSYVNDEEEEQEDDKIEEDDITKHHEKQKTDQEDTVRPLPYCESLVGIRSRLRSEGWALPNTYPMCHPLPEYFPSKNRQVRSQRKPSSTKTEISDPVTLIPCRSERPPSSKCCPKDLRKRRIDFAKTQITGALVASIEADRGTRRDIFNSSGPEVETVRPASPFAPHYSLIHAKVYPEVDSYEDPKVEWGTDEINSSGCRGRKLLPRLQDRDFKTLCQARQHQTHVDTVPDLRDNITYSKRVNFSGFNSSVFRG